VLPAAGGVSEDGYVCVIVARLRVPDSDSLKSKRKVVRSLKDSIRRRFGASVAEIGGHDSWHSATLLIAVTGGPEAIDRAESIERYAAARVPEGITFERHVRTIEDLR
jgi:uncharacterized protein YlxP (DUF503 family)